MDHEVIAIVLAALLAVSEALALIPGIKANSIFQLIVGFLAKAKDFFTRK